MQDANIALVDPIRSSEFITRKIVAIGLGTLFLAASSWISIPTVPVPITMQTYAVIVIGALFGVRLGVITVLAWLTEAAIGLPVLAHGASGIAPFVGPTAGYIFSFPVAAGCVGWLLDRRFNYGVVPCFLTMLAGNAINLALGVLWLSAIVGWHRAVIVGFLPFWAGGVGKALLATATVLGIHRLRANSSAESQ